MNHPKIHKLENGCEVYVCSKCKLETDNLKGFKTNTSQLGKMRFKWVCDNCYTMLLMKI